MDLRPGLVPASMRTQISGCEVLDQRFHLPILASHLEHLTNGVEQPSMGVNLLLVLCFDDKNNLNRHEVVWVLAMRYDQLRGGIDGQLRRVLHKCQVRETATEIT